jgi:hypothetical protein
VTKRPHRSAHPASSSRLVFRRRISPTCYRTHSCLIETLGASPSAVCQRPPAAVILARRTCDRSRFAKFARDRIIMLISHAERRGGALTLYCPNIPFYSFYFILLLFLGDETPPACLYYAQPAPYGCIVTMTTQKAWVTSRIFSQIARTVHVTHSDCTPIALVFLVCS